MIPAINTKRTKSYFLRRSESAGSEGLLIPLLWWLLPGWQKAYSLTIKGSEESRKLRSPQKKKHIYCSYLNSKLHEYSEGKIQLKWLTIPTIRVQDSTTWQYMINANKLTANHISVKLSKLQISKLFKVCATSENWNPQGESSVPNLSNTPSHAFYQLNFK